MKPTNRTPLLVAGVALGMLALSAANAQIQLKDHDLKLRPGAPSPAPTPQLRLKPDLTVHSIGFSSEFCYQACGDTWTRELGVLRISWETCSYRVHVKNAGSARSVPGQVRVQYQAINGPQTLTAPMPALRPGEVKEVVVPINNSRPRNAYFSIHHPFRVMVDSTNSNAESNESNNTAQARYSH